MSFLSMNVNDFLRLHDNLNYLRYPDNLNEYNSNIKNKGFNFGGSSQTNETIRVQDKFSRISNNSFGNLCINSKEDTHIIKDIRKALLVIHEALRDIEKNRVCKSLNHIFKAIERTEEELRNMAYILNKTF